MRFPINEFRTWCLLIAVIVLLFAVGIAPPPTARAGDAPQGLPDVTTVNAVISAREAAMDPVAFEFRGTSSVGDRPTPPRDMEHATVVWSSRFRSGVLNYRGHGTPPDGDIYAPARGGGMDVIQLVSQGVTTALGRPSGASDDAWKGARGTGLQFEAPSPLHAGICVLGVIDASLGSIVTPERAKIVGQEAIDGFGDCLVVDCDWTLPPTDHPAAPGSESARPARLWLLPSRGYYAVRGRLFYSNPSGRFDSTDPLTVHGRDYHEFLSWDVTSFVDGTSAPLPRKCTVRSRFANGIAVMTYAIEDASVVLGAPAERVREAILRSIGRAHVRDRSTQKNLILSYEDIDVPESRLDEIAKMIPSPAGDAEPIEVTRGRPYWAYLIAALVGLLGGVFAVSVVWRRRLKS